MALTYVGIASVTVGSGGASTIDFSSIPGTYTDLVLFTSLRGSGSYTGTSTYFTVNGNTSNRQSRMLAGNTGSIENDAGTALRLGYESGATATSNTFSNNVIYFLEYAGNNDKSMSNEGSYENNSTTNGTASVNIQAVQWSNSSAISSISITPYTGTFVQYSTATLYGIKNTV